MHEVNEGSEENKDELCFEYENMCNIDSMCKLWWNKWIKIKEDFYSEILNWLLKFDENNNQIILITNNYIRHIGRLDLNQEEECHR